MGGQPGKPKPPGNPPVRVSVKIGEVGVRARPATIPHPRHRHPRHSQRQSLQSRPRSIVSCHMTPLPRRGRWSCEAPSTETRVQLCARPPIG
jgi:hypothetical protein